MDAQEELFGMLAIAKQQAANIETMLKRLDGQSSTLKDATLAIKDCSPTLVQAVKDATDSAISKSMLNEKKTLSEAVNTAKGQFSELRPASQWDYVIGAVLGGLIVGMMLILLFTFLIMTGRISQPQTQINLDYKAIADDISKTLNLAKRK